MHALQQQVAHRVKRKLLLLPPSKRRGFSLQEICHRLGDHGIVSDVLSGYDEKSQHTTKLVHVGWRHQLPDWVQMFKCKV